MANTFLAGQFIVHQAFWPRGLWAAYTDTPYRLDLARARSLLAQAGHGDGFAVRLDTLTSPPFPAIAQAVRATLADAGIEAHVTTWEGAELWRRGRPTTSTRTPTPTPSPATGTTGGMRT